MILDLAAELASLREGPYLPSNILKAIAYEDGGYEQTEDEMRVLSALARAIPQEVVQSYVHWLGLRGESDEMGERSAADLVIFYNDKFCQSAEEAREVVARAKKILQEELDRV